MRDPLGRLIREPLVHILLLGVLLCAVADWLDGSGIGREEAIVVDRDDVARLAEQWEAQYGNPCTPQTAGLLGRLDVRPFNDLLERQKERSLRTDPQSVYTGDGEWEAVRSRLDSVSISRLAALSGVSRRMLRNLRKGDRKPSVETQEKITRAMVWMLNDRSEEKDS